MREIRPTSLLEPRSVAVVGATERPGAYGDTVIRNLQEAGFPGEILPVNPGRESVHGLPCLPSLLDLPTPADVVVVAVPAPAVCDAIRQSIETGCGGAVVVSAGFGETPAGAAREEELREIAAAAAFPVCGPNGNGVINLHHRAPLWGDSVPAGIQPGPVAMVSQSGNVAVNAIGSQRGIGFHTVVSTGNQAVLDTGAWLAAIAELDGVRAIVLFQETDGDGAGLADALATCAERQIGVAVLKVGTSQAGQAAAAAHTGAIAGDQRVFRALIEEAGAAWATDPHELLEVARVLAEPRARPRQFAPPPDEPATAPGGSAGLDVAPYGKASRSGVAILTCSGGDSGIAADQAEREGLQFAELGARTRERLATLLPDAATVGNPLDYTSLLWSEPEQLTEIVATVGTAETVEQMIIFHDHPADLRPEHEAEWAVVRRALAAGALESGCPAFLASTLPDLTSPEGRRELTEQGIPVVGGLRAAIAAATASQRLSPRRDDAAEQDRTPGSRLREIAIAARKAAGGNAGGKGPGGDGDVVAGGQPTGWLPEHAAKAVLREAGVGVPAFVTAISPAACLDASSGLSFPLVLKLSGEAIQHKSELGAVRVGIENEASLLEQAEELMSIAGQIHLDQALAPPVFLVEEMAAPGVELIVTARSDAVVPSLTIGLGGIWAEHLADSVVVPLPASPTRVKEALEGLQAYGLLTGGRGTGAADLDSLADLMAKTGQLLLEYRDSQGRGFDLIELNPVVANGEGATALDALAHLSPR